MPGAYCIFREFTVSRTAKFQSIGIFQIPMRDDGFHVSWKKNIVVVLGRYKLYLLEIFTHENNILTL